MAEISDKELIEALQKIIDKDQTPEEDREEARQLIEDLNADVLN